MYLTLIFFDVEVVEVSYWRRQGGKRQDLSSLRQEVCLFGLGEAAN